jgi:hypothetical protein
MDSHGLRRACAWIGNTPTVAIKHYSLLKHSDYIDAGIENGIPKSGVGPARNEENEGERNQKPLEKQGFSSAKHPRQDSNLRPTD